MGGFSAESQVAQSGMQPLSPAGLFVGDWSDQFEAHVLAHGLELVNLAPSVSRHLDRLYYPLRGLELVPTTFQDSEGQD